MAATVAGEEIASTREKIGPYSLGDVLGGGGMGVVYRGVGPDGRPVAVKTLRAHLRRVQDVQRFEREASIRIEHPNVIEVLDSGVDRDGTPYIVFELLEGESLEDRLERGQLSPAQAVPLIVDTCRALSAVHASGVVHRDLKPANLFCCANGTLKLLDFGIARVGDAKVTAEGMVVGTLSYLSPEQARGSSRVDPRTDVWALGAVLFEALTGYGPFDRPSAVATLLAILNEESPRLDGVAGVSTELADIVDRCLRKSPAERWPDVDALAEALAKVDASSSETILDHRPISRSADSFADTMAASAGRPSIRADEQRIVAVLLAREVSDMPAVEAAIESRGGRAFALLGKDAIGLFGAERWEGDETVRAIRAGLDCRLAAGAVAVGSGRIRSSGVGLAGEALRQAEVGTEAELVGVAIPAHAARGISDAFNARPAGPDLAEVVGERPAGASVAPQHDVDIVGRDVELAQVRAMASIAIDGQRATLVLVQGPPGIGKSRLRREVARQLVEERAPHVLLAQPESGHRSVAFAMWATALRRRAEVAAREEGWPRLERTAPPSERAMAVRMLAREGLPAKEADRAAGFLGQLLGVEVQHGVELEAARRDPRLMADRVRLALGDYLIGLVRDRPTVVVAEDLEWADAPSVELLVELLDRAKDAPLFVLGTARDDVSVATDLERRALLRLRLGGLGAAALGALAERVAGCELSPEVRRTLVARTEGNPLFAEQLVLDMRDAGSLEGAAEQPLPLSVEAAVQSRLDRLPEADRSVCKLLSLFGRPASVEELEALDVRDAPARLRDLVERDLLESAVGGSTTTYEFRSALMAEVAYHTIVPEIRRELHAKLGRALARSRGSDPEEAARHLERGGLHEDAARQYVDAVSAAALRGDSDSVLRCSDAALALGLDGDAARYALHMARADVLRFRGDREAQMVELDAALALASSDAELARARIEQAVLATRRGRLSEAMELAQVALAHAELAADREAHALALGRLGEIRMHRGELDAAEADLDAAAQLAHDGSPRLRAMIAEWRALLATSRGDIGASWEHFAEAADRAAEAGDERRAAGNLGNLADAYNRIGAHAEAIEALQRALEGCRRVGNRQFEGYVQLNLAYAQMASGRLDAALEAIEEAAALAVATGSERMAWGATIYRARCLVALGRDAEAEALALDWLARVGSEHEATSWTAAAHCLLGRIALHGGDVEAALAQTGAAMALRDELGGLEEDEADVFLARAEALRAAGRSEEAESVRRRGRERVEEVAQRIANPEWRDRFLRGPAVHRALWKGIR